MSRSLSSLAAVSVLLLMGAGCFSFGGSSTTSVALGGVWFSDDSGGSWTSKSTLPQASAVGSVSGLDVLSFEQDPSDPSAMYIGTATSGMFYSLDNAETWQRPEDRDAASGSVLDVQVDSRNVCTHYILKPERLLKTTTCGREYERETYVETRTEERLTVLAMDWYDPDILWIGTTQGDVLRSVDAGASWSAVYRAGRGITDIEVSNADSRIIMVGTSGRGVHRSLDGGTTWESLQETQEDFDDSETVYKFAQSKDGSRLLMSSEFGLMSTADHGTTWEYIPMVTDVAEVTVRAIGISTTDPNKYYYSTARTFYTSTSSGNSWTTFALPTTRIPSIIHVDSQNGDQVYLGTITPAK